MRHAAVLVAAFSLAASAALAGPSRYVNLDRPGVLDALSESNPVHYAKILVILEVAQMESCEHAPQILKAKGGLALDDVRCDTFTLLTSYPAKRHMNFVLDDVRYATNVAQVQLQRPRMVPVEKWNAQPLAGPRDLP